MKLTGTEEWPPCPWRPDSYVCVMLYQVNASACEKLHPRRQLARRARALCGSSIVAIAEIKLWRERTKWFAARAGARRLIGQSPTHVTWYCILDTRHRHIFDMSYIRANSVEPSTIAHAMCLKGSQSTLFVNKHDKQSRKTVIIQLR